GGSAMGAGGVDEAGSQAGAGLLRVVEAAVGELAGGAAVVDRPIPVPTVERSGGVGQRAVDAGDHAVGVDVELAAAAHQVGQTALDAGDVDPERVVRVVLGDDQVRVAGGDERLRRHQVVRLPVHVGGLEVRAGEVRQPVLAVAEQRGAGRGRYQLIDCRAGVGG